MDSVLAALPTLRTVLRAELEGYRALLALLRTEQTTLRGDDPDALTGIAARKMTAIHDLERLARQRSELLATCGMTAHRSGIDTGNAPAEAASALSADWTLVLEVATEAQRLNAANGRLIARHQRHWDGALASLIQANGRAPGYGADGRPAPLFAGRVRASV